MNYDFQVGDYVKFTRVIQATQKAGFRVDHATGKAIAVPEIAEQVLQQGGSGQITKLAKSKRKIAEVQFMVARVAAGNPSGVVTAILDDAILVGKQQGLFELAPIDSGGKSIYDTDGEIA